MSDRTGKRINVTRPDLPPYYEYLKLIEPLWESHHLTNAGALHNKLESELESYFNVKNVLLFCNGHLALSSALRVLNLSGEVITTPFTFASTTHAIVENGLTPVFCDIKPDDFTIDPQKIESLVTEKTSAVLGVHVYGNICDTDAIEIIAKRHNLKVIYDAAHAFGVVKSKKSAACFGDISMFSFHATKVFHTIEGGCLAFNDDLLSEPLERLKNFGIYQGYETDIGYGANAKMNEFSAAMGLCNLKYVDINIKKRKEIYEAYHTFLPKVDGFHICDFTTMDAHNYSYMPVFIDSGVLGINRDDVSNELGRNNINARKYFYPLITDFHYYKNKYMSNTPIAHRVADGILCLPMYAELELCDVKHIATLINKIVNNRNLKPASNFSGRKSNPSGTIAST